MAITFNIRDMYRLFRPRRKFLEMTLEQVAERSGLGKSTISDIERGKQSPSIENMSKLAKALDMDFEITIAFES